jgi:HK97 family phage portal protein
MTQTLNLTARPQGSRVLGAWLSEREGAAERAGIVALGENSASSATLSELTAMLGASSISASGASVTADSAMKVSAVYGCVSLIAGAIATLPLGVFERTAEGRDKADHPYWWLFNEQASEGWTSSAAIEYIISSKLFYGDGFGRLIRAKGGRVLGWEPLHPLSVYPFRHDGKILYRVTKSGEAPYTLDSSDVLHLPSLGFDGLTSPSPITYAAREAIGTAISAQQFSGQFFAGGANFDYALKTATKLTAEQLTQLTASLRTRAQNGPRGPLILSGGLEPAQLSVNSKDAEILATRLFTVEEICRVFGVPPHMVGHTDKTTSWGSGIESQGIGFVRYTLQRHLTPMAQEVNRKLWPVRERYFVEHITAALERGDLKGRYEAYRIAMGRAGEMPFMDANEVRRLENMPPHEDLQMNPGKADGKDTNEKPTE